MSRRQKLALLLGALFAFYLLPHLISRQPLSPDELDFDYFSSLLAREGKMSFAPVGDGIFGFKGFVPRDFAYNHEGEAVPWGPPGFILIAAIFRMVFTGWGVVVLNPLLGVLAVYLCYSLSRHVLEDEKAAFGAAVLLGTMPAFVHFDNFFVADILSVVIFLAASCSLVRLLKGGRTPEYLLFGVLCGSLVWVRYTNLILLPPLLVYILAHRRRVRLLPLCLAVVAALALAAAFLAYCRELYGGWFAIGYSSERIFESPFAAAAGGGAIARSLSLYRFRPWEIFSHLIYIPVSYSIAFPPFILALMAACADLRRGRGRGFFASYLALFLLIILLFGNYRVYGYEDRHMTLQSSFLRYSLPFLVFLPLLAAKFLRSVGQVRAGLIAPVAAFSLLVAVFGPFGTADTIGGRLYFSRVARFIADSTPGSSVLITSYWGKEIFPERMVFSRVAKLRPEEVDRVIDSIVENGYQPYYVEHPFDRSLLSHLKKRYDLEETTGPLDLPWFLHKVALPAELYPVRVFRFGSFEEREMPAVGL